MQNRLVAVGADLGSSLGVGQRGGEAGRGAEEGGGAHPLEGRLALQQALLTVGAGHGGGRRVDHGQHLGFSCWSHGEDRADPQVLLSTRGQRSEE